MRYILVLLIAAGFAGYLLPARLEATAGACGALERRLRTLVEAEIARMPLSTDPGAQPALARAKAQLPTAATLEQLARERLSMLPPEAGCAVGYWIAVFKPAMLTSLLPPVPAPRQAG
jgi:hypothetical protein